MTPSAIYSKSGKGVQEASGKTSLLSRSDRAVLSAFDGRITVKEVAERVGKTFDGQFEKIIRQLERDGFVREVSAGGAAGASARPAPPAQGRPAAPAGGGDELDFTSAIPATPRAAPPPDLAAKARAESERKAKEEQANTANSYKARQEADAKKQAETKAAEAKAAALAKAAQAAAKAAPPQDEARAEAARKLNLELPVFSKPAAFDPDATARMQAAAFAKAREEAEEKAQKERERIKAEAEAKLRAETEAKMRAEAEAAELERAEYARMAEADAKRKEAEAKIQAARAEAVRAAFEAERAKAKEDAERARKEAEELRQRLEVERKAREEADRARKEAEEKARQERERLARIEAERKAKEDQERQAKEEAARKVREEAERKTKEEQARKAREDAERQAREESERKSREDGERKVREEAQGRAKEEAQRAEREAEQALKEVERAQREANEKAQEEAKSREEAKGQEKEKKPVPAASGDSFADSLLADLDSFTQREDEEIKAKEEAIRKEKDEAARRVTAKAEAERKAREDAERQKRDEEEGRRKEEEARRAREEQERSAREAAERASREADERRRAEREAQMEKEAAALAKAGADDIVVTDDDLDMDDVKRDQAAISKEARERDKKAAKEREREAKEREREAKESAKERKRAEKRAASAPPPAAGAVAYAPIRRRRSWGKPVAITLLLLLAAGIGLLHVIPMATDEYEKAASEATGRPVKIASAHLSLYNGVFLKLDGVRIGDVRITSVRAYPEIASLMDDKKAFSHIDMDGVSLPQERIGEVLGAKVKSDRFSVARVNARHLKLVGVLEFPELEADLLLDRDGSVKAADLRGADGLAARLTPKGPNVEFDVTANSFTLPIAPEVTLSAFAMKGLATPESMRIDSWGGGNLDGAVSGNATVRWGSNWNIDGALTVRGINGAVFAPALLSEGKVEGSGRFSVNGPDPKRFMERGRLEGSFTVHKGVLGSVDLSRAIQTGGRQAEGRTPFTGLSAQGLFDKGAISLRNVAFNAGALNAGASADIASNGALSGRIIADIKTSSQTLRATVTLGGTVKEPQVKN